MIGNVMSAGSSAWDDVRLLLQVASKPDAIVDELQDLIAKAKAAQTAADKSAQDSAAMKATADTMLKAAQNAQDALVAEKTKLNAQWVKLNETADGLVAQKADAVKEAAMLSKVAADLSRHETLLDEREAAIKVNEKAVAVLKQEYEGKLAQLRSIVA